ncbi:ABC transporter ATP-binding protein [Iamia sp. SCSIO 61187]|uniref:ABC transporter ATP-binding protein n=1 Tax=Iamia sp. SCSIO 61187 TaxID=2722752 RepID=UPI001C631B2C|nr:ABC transporter ATP-binding protein [Iamia sp. SCSIO 61187]QYG93826.1 ABC transporter ATP-binding protein [Iamia sp. SCSIO 61187]
MAEVITIDSVSKVFKLAKDKPKSAKERVIRAGRIKWEEFRALDDVSFAVQQGETLAMLGHNGSGKSTLLKCVAGTLRPTTGTITHRGRLAALLELGAGFHPDLTGRENVFLNGSILGFSKAQVEGIFDDIVDFAELEEFIDLQVKHYSSGMYARLGFAVAINVDPDILLVDEVLSVGDEAFQRKCIDRIRRMQREGRTILVVSHATDLVRQIADRAVVLDHGKMVADAAPGEAIRAFREALAARGVDIPLHAEETDHTPPTLADPVTGEMPIIVSPNALVDDPGATVRIRHVIAEYPDEDAGHMLPGQPLKLRIGYTATGMITDVAFAVEIFDEDGTRLMGTTTDVLEQYIHAVKGDGEVNFVFDNMPLLDGTFPLTVAIHSHDGGTIYDEREFEDTFSVMNPGRTRGIVNFPVKVEHLFNF